MKSIGRLFIGTLIKFVLSTTKRYMKLQAKFPLFNMSRYNKIAKDHYLDIPSKINYIEQDKNYGQKPNILLSFILTYLV